MRTLFLDEETFPFVGLTWGKYDQTVNKFVVNSKIVCISWKWLGEDEVYVMALPDYKGYRGGWKNYLLDKTDDKALVKDLWDLLDRADLVVAHNGDRFDVKMANARFNFHGLPPPSPYKTVDTKKVAKAAAMFPSNKLADLGPYLHEGEKIDTGGFSLWERCIAGEMQAWDEMKAYNKQDVILLEKVYLHLRPWAKSHPNSNVYNETTGKCPSCGGDNLVRRGYRYTTTGRRRSYQCKSCYSWCSGEFVNMEPALR